MKGTQQALVLGAACLLTVSVVEAARPPHQDAGRVAIPRNPIPSTPESIAAGRQIFRRACGSCHGLDGKGGKLQTENPDPGPDAPDLTDARWEYGSSDGEIFLNTKYGIGPRMYMDKWGDQLKDDQIWNIVNYIRSLG